MKVLLVDNGTRYLKKLKSLLSENNIQVIHQAEIVDIKNSDADLVILSGGHTLPVTDKRNPYTVEIAFVKETTIPVFGICLGYEIIAHAFSAELLLMKRREKGLLEISPIKRNGIFKNIKDFSVYENHRWVVKNLPKDLIGLAKSKDGYEVIKHKKKPIYGFQFHPEMFVGKSSGDEIFRNLLDIIAA